MGDSTSTDLASAAFSHHTRYATMTKPNEKLVEFPRQSARDILTDVLRDGAQQMLATAIEAEVDDYLAGRDELGLSILGVDRLAFRQLDNTEPRAARPTDVQEARGQRADLLSMAERVWRATARSDQATQGARAREHAAQEAGGRPGAR